MAFIPVNQVKAEKKANGKGEITINHLLGANRIETAFAGGYLGSSHQPFGQIPATPVVIRMEAML